MLAHLEIMALECGHASIRRNLVGRNQTWTTPLQKCSSDWFMLRQRVLERRPPGHCLDKDSGSKGETHEQPPKRHRGAGPQRACMSNSLTGRTYKSLDERREAFIAANREQNKHRTGVETRYESWRSRAGVGKFHGRREEQLSEAECADGPSTPTCR